MQRLVHALTIAAGVGLAAACAGPGPGESASAAGAGPGEPPAAAAAALPATGAVALPTTGGGGQAAGEAAGASAHPEGRMTDSSGHEGTSGMDHGDATAASGGVQAGWYRDGTFQPCGREQSLELSDTARVESEIRAGGMQAGEPVYVRLAGENRQGVFQVRQVVQVGSPTPVRDCPMTGTVIQGG